MSSWRSSEGWSEGFWLVETKMSSWRSSEGPSEGFWLDETKLSSWRSSEGPSEGFWLDETNMLSWRSSGGLSKGFWLEKTKQLVRMTMRPTCRPARLIWLDDEGNLSFLLGRFWLDDPMDLSCWNTSDWLIRWSAFSVFFWLLCRAISDSHTRLTRKRLRKIVFFRRWIRRSDLFLTRETDKTNVTFVYLLYQWRSNVTVHYANDVAW